MKSFDFKLLGKLIIIASLCVLFYNFLFKFIPDKIHGTENSPEAANRAYIALAMVVNVFIGQGIRAFGFWLDSKNNK